MDVVIYGADSETVRGEPNSFQYYSEHANIKRIDFVTARNATRKFFAFLATLTNHNLHVFYVHNLQFDLPEFLWDMKAELVAVSGGEFDFTYGEWHVRGVYGSPTFCTIRHAKKNSTIMFVDSYLWFQTSLDKAAEIVCPELRKLTRPKDLGTHRYTPKDRGFVEYAMRDAEIDFHIGVAVQAMHKEYDIRQAVSLADMSAKIFRHHFLNYTIPQPNRDIVLASWKSYHGGKNNVIKGAAPAWHIDVTSLDISSAYPYAMSELPAFSNKRLYRSLPAKNRAPRIIPPFGVYCVSGIVEKSDYPVLFSHSFKPLHGKISHIWVQGMELAEAIKSGKFKCSRFRGFCYDFERDKRDPALAEFVAHFYKLKQTEKNPVKRYMYKIILNALYGKFIQTRKGGVRLYTDIDTNETAETSDLVAGGMFHPFIASAITAHTRAYIHQIENTHRAIHTATDGIYTRMRRAKRMPGRPSKGLGSLQIEGRGDLVLLRNKCYILYAPEGKTPSQFFKGKRIHKYAKHGFQGGIYDLERIVAHGGRQYTATRPRRLREAIKSGATVNEFFTRAYVLKVGQIGVKNEPRKNR